MKTNLNNLLRKQKSFQVSNLGNVEYSIIILHFFLVIQIQIKIIYEII